MSDLGAIGQAGNLTSTAAWLVVRSLVVGTQQPLAVGCFRNDSDGTPSPPSLQMDRPGKFEFLWLVAAGARTIAISVKQEANTSPRPKMTVLANPSIGVNSDVSDSAASSTGYVSILLNVSPTSGGLLLVRLENFHVSTYSPAFFDQLVTA